MRKEILTEHQMDRPCMCLVTNDSRLNFQLSMNRRTEGRRAKKVPAFHNMLPSSIYSIVTLFNILHHTVTLPFI